MAGERAAKNAVLGCEATDGMLVIERDRVGRSARTYTGERTAASSCGRAWRWLCCEAIADLRGGELVMARGRWTGREMKPQWRLSSMIPTVEARGMHGGGTSGELGSAAAGGRPITTPAEVSKSTTWFSATCAPRLLSLLLYRTLDTHRTLYIAVDDLLFRLGFLLQACLLFREGITRR